GEGDEIKAKLEGYKKILGRLVPHDGLGRPVTNGYCIDGATITGVIPEVSSGVFMRPPGLKAGLLYMGTVEAADPTKLKDTPGLDPRTMSAFGNLEIEKQKYDYLKSNAPSDDPEAPKSFDVIRKGVRAAAGRPGEEAVWRIEYHNGAVVYYFRWLNSDAAPSTPDNPSLTLSLDVGDEMDPSKKVPPEPQMFALWDATLDSIKPRH
ncbi:T6SS immunity protein Tli4 family protein, partial [Xanthomonas oryzae]